MCVCVCVTRLTTRLARDSLRPISAQHGAGGQHHLRILLLAPILALAPVPHADLSFPRQATAPAPLSLLPILLLLPLCLCRCPSLPLALLLAPQLAVLLRVSCRCRQMLRALQLSAQPTDLRRVRSCSFVLASAASHRGSAST